MLSGEALELAFALRKAVGTLSQGDGPLIKQLRDQSSLSEVEFDRALSELEDVGFVARDGQATGNPSMKVLAPLQIYLDDLESQGSDDF